MLEFNPMTATDEARQELARKVFDDIVDIVIESRAAGMTDRAIFEAMVGGVWDSVVLMRLGKVRFKAIRLFAEMCRQAIKEPRDDHS